MLERTGMDSLDTRLLKGASGENRFDPDQQRYYLGTYAERIVLALPLTEVDHEKAKGYITAQLPHLKEAYFPLSFKLSSEFGSAYQMYYMKLAQQNALSATIVDEKGAVSPFALIIHSDHAITKEETNLKAILDKLSNSKPAGQTKAKGKSLWQRLFH
ncbi:TPA: DUF1694 domain-containing protein [Streptococcus equi subsp. zooepidemicus]|nr:DUF1694 domain-containing protein [Streptococcus equi]MDI5946620.1 DUF1694 domain-containing protein [Streptococcus equi subsp. zooepidemicus]